MAEEKDSFRRMIDSMNVLNLNPFAMMAKHFEDVATITAERDRYKTALEQIACYNDKEAFRALIDRGTYSLFDEPRAAQVAYEALNVSDRE